MSRAEEAHRNPAVERSMALLDEIERSPNGVSLDELVLRTSVSRSSAYRILNSLETHRMIRSLRGGSYILGSRILQLASHTAVASRDFDLPRIVQPYLERAAEKVGETVKISIFDRGAVLVIAGAAATTEHSLRVVVGGYLPLHAGAASKVLLAYLPQDKRERILHANLKRFTRHTLTTEAELLPELDLIKMQGWSSDMGEYSINVNSYGAPIFTRDGDVVAAISIPFGAGRDQVHHDRVRDTAISTVAAIRDELVRH